MADGIDTSGEFTSPSSTKQRTTQQTEECADMRAELIKLKKEVSTLTDLIANLVGQQKVDNQTETMAAIKDLKECMCGEIRQISEDLPLLN